MAQAVAKKDGKIVAPRISEVKKDREDFIWNLNFQKFTFANGR